MASFSTFSRIAGEILVIVVGTLLALAADTWMNELEQRQKEVEHLSAVLLDLESTLDE